jgi:uncharacterized protein (TIGR03790 family)
MGAAFLRLVACCALFAASLANEPGREVVLVFNSSMPESKAVAEHYAAARGVPASQIVGLSLPTTETISREDYQTRLERPLWRELTTRKLFATNPPLANPAVALSDATIRYAVLCYGVPVKILPEPSRKEEGVEKLQLELRRNEAAVDSELALLPYFGRSLMLAGPTQNPVQAVTNAAAIHPTNGVLMVARLDGPTAEIARGLVDKALLAERDGLWGRAYFDWRGLNEGAYRVGDEWIRNGSEVAKAYGFDVITDRLPNTFPPSTPLSDIALYFGWYDQGISGPFTNGMAAFRPGAIAYHLHSFSARALRVTDAWWVGPLLDRGVTATIGCTEEPYLQTTPQVHLLLHRLLFGRFTFGEAAYASQNTLSWQNTVIGDPLYRPFGKGQQERHADLEARNDPNIDWSILMWINVRLQQGAQLPEIERFYASNPRAKNSAILQEKFGDIYNDRGKMIDAMGPYRAALKLEMSPLQRLRVSMTLASIVSSFGKPEEAYEMYHAILREHPNYPGKTNVYERLSKLATRLEKKDEAAEYQRLARSGE